MDKEEYKDKRRIINHERDKKLSEIAREYALSNNTVSNGDIVTCCNDLKIIVDRIQHTKGTDACLPECAYSGFVLTKAGKPRKDKMRSKVYQNDLKK